MDFHHVSVLLNETVEALVTNTDGIYVDCTLGGAGHSAAIAERLGRAGRLVGIDQDTAALEAARRKLAEAVCRVDIVHDNFKNLAAVLDALHITAVDGILFDLGVSSHQLDTAERGFSYMQDARLDMRMDTAAALSAYDVVNKYSAERLNDIIFHYGEERWAKRIAEFIVKERRLKPVETTGELVEIIKKAIPAAARKDGGHPAKRTFQAIRIEVNDELKILESTFATAIRRLKPGGRICIITFHSLEDRIAKNLLQKMARNCLCPPKQPICTCGHRAEVKVLGKARIASAVELSVNSRAKSAKLRVAEKR